MKNINQPTLLQVKKELEYVLNRNRTVKYILALLEYARVLEKIMNCPTSKD